MTRDFYLVLGGGVVSLMTTLIVLFVTDWVYRHDQARERRRELRSDSFSRWVAWAIL